MQIEKIRHQFPFLSQEKPPIYLDNASTTQKPKVVLDAIIDFYTHHNGNPGRGNHRLSREATEIYELARATIAELIHAPSAQEIIFTRNTTESINLLSHTIGEQIVQKGDVILLTQLEHHSNLLPWIKLAQKNQARIEYIPVDRDGHLSWPEKLSELKNKSVKILSLSHVSNVLGTITPVRNIIEQAKKLWPDVITIVDAAQSIAHEEVNIDHLKCDFLAFSGHKIYAPTGIGVLYGHREQLRKLEPFLVGGGMVTDVTWNSYKPLSAPSRFEAGTVNTAAAAGLMSAIKFVRKIKIDKIREHESTLTNALITGLQNAHIDGLLIYGLDQNDPFTDHIGLVSINIDGIYAEDLANYLDTENIMVRSGHHCTMPLHQDILKINSTMRISIGVYNTIDEIEALVQSIQKSTQLLR